VTIETRLTLMPECQCRTELTGGRNADVGILEFTCDFKTHSKFRTRGSYEWTCKVYPSQQCGRAQCIPFPCHASQHSRAAGDCEHNQKVKQDLMRVEAGLQAIATLDASGNDAVMQ